MSYKERKEVLNALIDNVAVFEDGTIGFKRHIKRDGEIIGWWAISM